MTPDQLAERLVVLRQDAAEIIALIDTRELPPPTREIAGKHWSGPVWEVGRGIRQWKVLVDPTESDSVFTAAPWEIPGDVASMPVEEARNLAMALLAAASEADRARRPSLVVSRDR